METGSPKEKAVFEAQIEMGLDLVNNGNVIGVHTPRNNKMSLTHSTLEILERFSGLSQGLVVDHCTLETAPS